MGHCINIKPGPTVNVEWEDIDEWIKYFDRI